MNEPRDIRLKRLLMRSMRRGIKEMDLILEAFARRELQGMHEDELDCFEAFLSENDQELYAWVSGQTAPPERFERLVARIVEGLN